MADLVAAWLPVVFVVALFLGGAWWVSRQQMRSYGQHVAEVKAINDEIVATNRDMIAELREIKQILKDRN